MKRFPLKALFIGTLMCLVINVVMSYGVLAMGTFNWTGDFISGGAILLLFLLILVYNTPLVLVRRQWALSSQELVLVYTMMIVATAIPTVGLTAQLIPFLAEVFYYATPENAWSELIHPHLKSWLVPQDDLAVFYFFEGLPERPADSLGRLVPPPGLLGLLRPGPLPDDDLDGCAHAPAVGAPRAPHLPARAAAGRHGAGGRRKGSTRS